MADVISTQKANYAAAQAAGNKQGMVDAAKAADAYRVSQGQAAQNTQLISNLSKEIAAAQPATNNTPLANPTSVSAPKPATPAGQVTTSQQVKPAASTGGASISSGSSAANTVNSSSYIKDLQTKYAESEKSGNVGSMLALATAADNYRVQNGAPAQNAQLIANLKNQMNQQTGGGTVTQTAPTVSSAPVQNNAAPAVAPPQYDSNPTIAAIQQQAYAIAQSSPQGWNDPRIAPLHQQAEDYRISNLGYSGGADGSQKIPVDTTQILQSIQNMANTNKNSTTQQYIDMLKNMATSNNTGLNIPTINTSVQLPSNIQSYINSLMSDNYVPQLSTSYVLPDNIMTSLNSLLSGQTSLDADATKRLNDVFSSIQGQGANIDKYLSGMTDSAKQQALAWYNDYINQMTQGTNQQIASLQNQMKEIDPQYNQQYTQIQDEATSETNRINDMLNAAGRLQGGKRIKDLAELTQMKTNKLADLAQWSARQKGNITDQINSLVQNLTQNTQGATDKRAAMEQQLMNEANANAMNWRNQYLNSMLNATGMLTDQSNEMFNRNLSANKLASDIYAQGKNYGLEAEKANIANQLQNKQIGLQGANLASDQFWNQQNYGLQATLANIENMFKEKQLGLDLNKFNADQFWNMQDYNTEQDKLASQRSQFAQQLAQNQSQFGSNLDWEKSKAATDNAEAYKRALLDYNASIYNSNAASQRANNSDVMELLKTLISTGGIGGNLGGAVGGYSNDELADAMDIINGRGTIDEYAKEAAGDTAKISKMTQLVNSLKGGQSAGGIGIGTDQYDAWKNGQKQSQINQNIKDQAAQIFAQQSGSSDWNNLDLMQKIDRMVSQANRSRILNWGTNVDDLIAYIKQQYGGIK